LEVALVTRPRSEETETIPDCDWSS
jgi:hypothetical protein